MKMALDPKIAEAMQEGRKKILGPDSLTLGEIVFTLIGVFVIMGDIPVVKVKIPFVGVLPQNIRLWLGLFIIFVGEWLF